MLSAVTASLATIDAWTIGQAMGYMLFSPGKMHDVWPDYGYQLKSIKEADICSAEKLSLHSDFWLGKVFVVAATTDTSNPATPSQYQGFALSPKAAGPHLVSYYPWATSVAVARTGVYQDLQDRILIEAGREISPTARTDVYQDVQDRILEELPRIQDFASYSDAHPGKSGLASWTLELSDLCQWLEGSAYNRILIPALESVNLRSDEVDLLVVTDRVMPDRSLEFSKRFKIQPISEVERWDRAVRNWGSPPG